MSAAERGRPVPAGFFALRTPLLPCDELEAFFDATGPSRPEPGPGTLAEALAADRLRARRLLAEFIGRPEVREALFLASPDLLDSLNAWEEDPDGPRGRRVERAVVKYLVRMASRPTPFGLFAGNGVGLVADETHLARGEREACARHSRLDFEYLLTLTEALGLDPALRRALTWRPNSSLYRAGDRWRFVEGHGGKNGRSYSLVAVEDSAALRETLARAEAGSTIAALAGALVDGEISFEEAETFVVDLAESQVLVPELGLALTGLEPVRVMASRIAALPGTTPVVEALSRAADSLAALDAAGAAVDPERYRQIAAALPELPARPDLSRIFQVDVVTSGHPTIGGLLLEEMERAAEITRRLMPRSRPAFDEFKEAFRERYGEQEVPLVHALDEESGIGYPAYASEGSAQEPLLSGLDFPAPRGDGKARWGPRERLLLSRLHEAWSRGETEIVLGDSDLDEMAPRETLPLPDAFAVVGAVSAASDEALASGDFLFVFTGLDGPAGACLLGRFCHSDPVLRQLVEEHLREEEAVEPGALFAEVVHLPEGRAGNVLLRPVLRRFEIPFLGSSGAPEDRQIPLSDLLVSVAGDRVVLRSRRLGRRVVPRITAAHDYTRNSLGIYRFLGELQTMDVAVGRPFGWGPLDDAPFLPRVRTGRIVLSPARWNVSAAEVAPFARLDEAARLGAIRDWRDERRIPRMALLLDDDGNELVVDFEAPLSVDVFLDETKGRDRFPVTEMLVGPGRLCTRGPEGRFVNELVVPFVRRKPPDDRPAPGECPSPERAAAALPAAFRRDFPPGSEWLTAKVYAGVAAADRLLGETLAPFVRESLATGAADSWFFVRYADPRPHIRLRLHGDPRRLREEVLPGLLAALEASPLSGQVRRLQLDTYEREVERYGGPEAIALVEQAFFADSDAVLALLELLDDGQEGGEERWQIAFRGADALLDDFGFDLPGRRRLVEAVRRELGLEHGLGAAFGRALGQRYRGVARELERVLDPADDPESPLAPGFVVLRQRSVRLRPVAEELKRLDRDGKLTAGVPAVVASLVHMHLNRLLRSSQRQQELVICDFLSRLYASRLARGR